MARPWNTTGCVQGGCLAEGKLQPAMVQGLSSSQLWEGPTGHGLALSRLMLLALDRAPSAHMEVAGYSVCSQPQDIDIPIYEHRRQGPQLAPRQWCASRQVCPGSASLLQASNGGLSGGVGREGGATVRGTALSRLILLVLDRNAHMEIAGLCALGSAPARRCSLEPPTKTCHSYPCLRATGQGLQQL
jgi:hypothetical protein